MYLLCLRETPLRVNRALQYPHFLPTTCPNPMQPSPTAQSGASAHSSIHARRRYWVSLFLIPQQCSPDLFSSSFRWNCPLFSGSYLSYSTLLLLTSLQPHLPDYPTTLVNNSDPSPAIILSDFNIYLDNPFTTVLSIPLISIFQCLQL